MGVCFKKWDSIHFELQFLDLSILDIMVNSVISFYIYFSRADQRLQINS